MSRQERDRYLEVDEYERAGEREYRNGFYERSFVTIFGTLVLRIARTRRQSFLPGALERFQRRAEEVMLLIREAFLRGVSTRQVGRLVAIVTGESVSAQTVSQLSRHLDRLVKAFQQAPLKDEWAYLFLDGVSLRVRRPSGRKRVQMLVAYGVKHDGTPAAAGLFAESGRKPGGLGGFSAPSLYRGLTGNRLLLIVTDGCPGLAAALQTVYPRVKHQRCWVHKMRNILEKVRKRDYDAVKAGAQAIYRADSQRQASQAFRRFRARWQGHLPVDGEAVGEGFARIAHFLRLSQAPLAKAADHECHRALLRGSPPPHATDGLLRQRGQRRPHHLCDLQWPQ